MVPHDLAREGEADAGTFLLSREEWYEYLFLTCDGNRSPVVGDPQDDFVVRTKFPGNPDTSRSGLQGVLYQVYEYLGNLSLVDEQHQVRIEGFISAGRTGGSQVFAVQGDDLVHQFLNVDRPADGFGHTAELPVGLDKLYQVLR